MFTPQALSKAHNFEIPFASTVYHCRLTSAQSHRIKHACRSIYIVLKDIIHGNKKMHLFNYSYFVVCVRVKCIHVSSFSAYQNNEFYESSHSPGGVICFYNLVMKNVGF